MAQENLNKLFSPVLVVESVTASKSLDQYDSGKIFTLDAAAGLTVTLPAVADAGAGWFCKIIVGVAATAASYIITEKTSADTNVLCTQVTELETDTSDDGPYNAGHTTITLTHHAVSPLTSVGDTFDILCNGSKYFIQATTVLDGGAALA